VVGAFYTVPRIYSSCLISLTNLQPSITVARIMETIIFTIFACILLLSRDKNLLHQNPDFILDDDIISVTIQQKKNAFDVIFYLTRVFAKNLIFWFDFKSPSFKGFLTDIRLFDRLRTSEA
jgi:hypothetical protein